MGKSFFDQREPALLDAFHQKEPAALAYLYQLYFEVLQRFAQRWVKDPAVVLGIVTDSFIRLWAHPARFTQLAGIRGFLYVTTRHLCADHWRDRANRPQRLAAYNHYYAGHARPDLFPTLLDNVPLQQLVAALRARLPARAQLVWDCVYREDLNNQQIAERLGVHVRTVQRERALIHTLVKSAPFQRQVQAIRRELDL